jgi:hypothetical protein
VLAVAIFSSSFLDEAVREQEYSNTVEKDSADDQ